jgi:hypothetical protein
VSTQGTPVPCSVAGDATGSILPTASLNQVHAVTTGVERAPLSWSMR